MFYKLIEKKRNEWFSSPNCKVKDLILYIEQQGKMRDAQIEAIKSFLFMKLACQNKPLWQLFCEGTFNSLDLDPLEISHIARQVLKRTPAAKALFEYSRMTDRNGRQLAPLMEQFIKDHPEAIDYEHAFRDIFYGVSYPDYIFSLPMGAGKTFLMAAFIHLELYFSMLEPDNPSFAHNFMVMAPSGLKSSIVPSIRHIQDFDPTWILPEPAASQIHSQIQFEILDEQKTASKSNLVKNPNAQKINNHQPLSDLWGLVAVTNAEKVILDKWDKEKGSDRNFYTAEEWERVKLSNELREIIKRIPSLSIYIDEVHHASDSDIKLRQVVNEWTKSQNFNSVLGFSGTPYLKTSESVTLGGDFTIRNTDLSNVVYDYPLVKGIGNFLKRPRIKTTSNTQEAIIREGVTEFLNQFKDTIYPNGTCAKLAIYCSRIENLEEQVFPMVTALVSSQGLDPSETILRYHGGNKDFPITPKAKADFEALDTDISKYKIILLAQIGKEGWDCKSLAGVILPQKGACPQNMVLQTSCRCLRQVERGDTEEQALIWLNDENANILNKELQKQQNTSIKEVNDLAGQHLKRIDRFVRRDVPPIDFYQLKIHYNTLIVEEDAKPTERLNAEQILAASLMEEIVTHEQDLQGHVVRDDVTVRQDDDELEPITFRQWLMRISKEGMGMMPMSLLLAYEKPLRRLFSMASYTGSDGVTFLLDCYDQKRVRSLVRQAFSPKRDIEVRKETIHDAARILVVENLETPIYTNDDSHYYPKQAIVHNIVEEDQKGSNPNEADAQTEAAINQIRQLHLPNEEELIAQLLAGKKSKSTEVKDKTYHYLPYKFDSGLEIRYFADRLLTAVAARPLEVYFNGDDQLTAFKINCYHRMRDRWNYIGRYVPDFLMLQRDAEGKIYKVLIIETKGEGYAAKFVPRREFMEQEFLRLNNGKFGYQRFDFLYIEDTMTPDEQTAKTIHQIKKFFNID
ncbi:MAG: DEAD/DEAH box helicase family protein [Prevotella sp.]|nr:DEAD/DEAH box helicase family protein [Prevotella sp.]